MTHIEVLTDSSDAIKNHSKLEATAADLLGLSVVRDSWRSRVMVQSVERSPVGEGGVARAVAQRRCWENPEEADGGSGRRAGGPWYVVRQYVYI